MTVYSSHLHYEIRKKSSPSLGWTSNQQTSTYEPTDYLKKFYAAEQQTGIHIVKAGETLTGLVAKYNTTVKAIADLNKIANVDLIRVGQKLNIPEVTQTQVKPVYYTVRPGDTLSRIAVNNKTTVKQLQSWNNITNPNIILAGQKIRVK